MKIYQPAYQNKTKHVMFVQPGHDYPVSDWLDEHGKPRMFMVALHYGQAEVADNLGQYMIDKGLAQSSPLIIPRSIAA